ncbi:MAG TPA: hypothetical protein VGE26_01435 [Sphingobacteriaceae bacterium]
MKRIVACVFLLSIIYQSVGQLSVMAYYRINRDVITLTRCENRAKPALKCEGMCYLTKQLKKLDEGTRPVKSNKETKVEIPVYLPEEPVKCGSVPVLQSSDDFFYPTPAVLNQPSDIFHPPC